MAPVGYLQPERQAPAGAWRERGEQILQWDGRDDAGSAVASGVYFVRIEADTRILHAKMTLVR